MSIQNKANMFSNSPSDKQNTLLTKKTGNNSSNSNFNINIDFTFINIIWCNAGKRLILLVTISVLFITSIIITIFVNPEFVKPDCSGVCKKPFKIKVYSDKALIKQLEKCGYKQGTTLFKYSLGAIKRHNIQRACHNAPPLRFNCEIMKFSQNYSEYLANVLDTLKHSSSKYGENLAWTGWKESRGEIPTNMWYEEIKGYDWSVQGYNHMTQLLWKGSREFGIGLACKRGCYMAADYYPAGNVLGYLRKNVQPLRD